MKRREQVIITGHTGVIGSALHRRLAGKGIELALVNSRGVFTQSPGREMQMVTQDVFDRSALRALFDNARVCVHLAAAQSGAVSEGITGALLRNALLTDYFAALAVESDLPAFIYSSSGAVYYRYADPSLQHIDEDTEIHADLKMVEEVMEYLKDVRRKGNYGHAYSSVMNVFGSNAVVSSISPRSGYAFGKYIGELCVEQHLPVTRCTSLRLANSFGPDDREDRIVRRFIRTAVNGETLDIYDWSRNFIWIDDLLDIIEKSIDLVEESPRLVNAYTPGNTSTLWNLAQLINSMLSETQGQFTFNPTVYEPHYQWETLYPAVLPENPVSLIDGLKRILST